MIPKRIWGHKSLAFEMEAASPSTRFLPVPQFNATVVNTTLGEWDNRGKELLEQAAEQTLGIWMQHLRAMSKANAWRYIAALEDCLSSTE